MDTPSREEHRHSQDNSRVLIRVLGSASRGAKFFWSQLGLTLVFLLVLELFARGYLWAVGANHYEDPRARADAYINAPWSKEVLREYNERTVGWHAYVYWIGEPYVGRYTHVDSKGIRRTWKSPNRYRKCHRVFRVFMFGGSTMWGEGSRDDYTIPSWLQRMLDEHDSCVDVTNFGQDGYVSTQEMLLLADQIHQGNIPDLAIFYDGYNDVHSAALNDAPGLTYDEQARRREFNVGNLVTPGSAGMLATQWTLLAKISLSEIVHSLGLSWFARRIVATLSPGSYVEANGVLVRRPTRALAGSDNGVLADATARDYLANITIEKGMAREFGFRCLFYWQPWLGDKYPLTSYEQQQMRHLLPGLKNLAEAVRQRVAQGNGNGEIKLLGSIFNSVFEPCFIDEIHVSEDGNRRIAERILADALDAIEQMKAESDSDRRQIKNTSGG